MHWFDEVAGSYLQPTDYISDFPVSNNFFKVEYVYFLFK